MRSSWLLILFLCLPVISQAMPSDDPVSFSKAELASIKKQYGSIPLNRIADYNRKIKSLQPLASGQKLTGINNYLNKLIPAYDMERLQREDYWLTPKEFLTLGTGDCEDYVIIKYYSLIKLGFDKSRLFFAVVRDKYSGGYHMVLLYEEEEGQSPLVLDNLSFRIMPLKARNDLVLKDFFNSAGRYKYVNGYQKKPFGSNYAQFIKLQKRVAAGF